MKKFLLILVVLICSNIANGEILLQGSAEYNVDSALNLVSDSVKYKIDMRIFSPFLVDYNNVENLNMILKGKLDLKDRTLATFSVGTYGIVYKNDTLHAYYYSNKGNIEYVDLRSDTKYPYKSYQYDINGNLVNMGLRVSKTETYIYNPQGKLIAHWVKGNGFDEHGNIIMKRKYLE